MIVTSIREMLERHHVNPEALERTRKVKEAIERLGLGAEQARLRRFPTTDVTRKGNLAEIVLAEYVVSACGADLPIYRLRYNPNVDQSMKGDDVLAFDLDANPARVIVGEAKFRSTSTSAAVEEVVSGLIRSRKGGVPVSLQFVADRLFEEGKPELAARVMECAKLFAEDRLRLDYVGLLLSDTQSANRVNDGTPGTIRRLAMVSLGLSDLEPLVGACYSGLD